MKFILTYSFLLISCFGAISQNALNNSLVGYSIIDVKNNCVVAESNGDIGFTPASTLKLITTASVLEAIPAQKRFETIVEYEGDISNGILYGNIIVRGCGDPTIGSENFNSSANKVFSKIFEMMQNYGITKLCGDIICDNSIFPYNGARGAWLVEDMGNYFAAESYGFNFIDNQYTLFFNTGAEGSEAVIADCKPSMSELNFINKLSVKGEGKDSAYITGLDFDKTRLLNGRMPCNKSMYKLKGSIPSPDDVFKREFQYFLINNGAWVENKKVVYGSKRGRLGAIYSPTLADIVKVTNYKSNNMYAETLLKWCGLMRGGKATTQNGINSISQIWNDKGIDIKGVNMFDGSGLSPKNRITPNALACILCGASFNEAFRNSLPKVGVEGTVKNFMKGSEIAKYLKLKTGSMQGVQCYAGYFDNGSKCYAVVVMVNNFKGKRKDIQNEIGLLIENLITK